MDAPLCDGAEEERCIVVAAAVAFVAVDADLVAFFSRIVVVAVALAAAQRN